MTSPEFAELRDVDHGLLDQARQLYAQYLAEPSDPPWRELLLPEPGVSVGLVLEGCVIGIAYGALRRKPGLITLRGIAVQGKYKRRSYGSQLLGYFESRARDAGFPVVTLGSAGGYVDHFYEKNGYRCVAYLVNAPVVKNLYGLRQRYSEYVESVESDASFSIDVASMAEATRLQFIEDFKEAELAAFMDKAIAAPEELGPTKKPLSRQQTQGICFCAVFRLLRLVTKAYW